MTVKAVAHVKESAKSIGVAQLAHTIAADLCSALPCFGRRVGADPISFGHVSVQTTERYLAASSGFDQRS